MAAELEDGMDTSEMQAGEDSEPHSEAEPEPEQQQEAGPESDSQSESEQAASALVEGAMAAEKSDGDGALEAMART